MQLAQDSAQRPAAVNRDSPALSVTPTAPDAEFRVIRRNGAVFAFEPGKIMVAMTRASLAVNGSQSAASARIRERVAGLTDGVVGALMRRHPAGGTFPVEDVRDQVELALMRARKPDVARASAHYRDERASVRTREPAQCAFAGGATLHPKERSLFDTRVIEYRTGGALNWN